MDLPVKQHPVQKRTPREMEDDMTCQNCGTALAASDAYCPNCGARTVPPGDSGGGPEAGRPGHDLTSGLQEITGPTRERKKKVNIGGILSIIGSVIVAVLIIYTLVQSGQTDWVGSVKEYYSPFENVGYEYTCGQVFGRYMPQAQWSESVNGDSARVTVHGPLLAASEFEVRFDVEKVQGEKDQAYYSVVSGMVDGEVLSSTETLEAMALMWDAYAEGWTKAEFEEIYG